MIKVVYAHPKILNSDLRLLTPSVAKRRYDLFSERAYAFTIVEPRAAQVDDKVGYPGIDVGLDLLANRCRVADQERFARLFYAYAPDLSYPLQQCLRASRIGIDKNRREI